MSVTAQLDDRVECVWGGHRCKGTVTGIDEKHNYSVLLKNGVVLTVYPNDIIRIIEKAPT